MVMAVPSVIVVMAVAGMVVIVPMAMPMPMPMPVAMPRGVFPRARTIIDGAVCVSHGVQR